ncbi:MAG: hypothetical protein L0H84_04565 [Pseudonocardia sp.]|nr:hypothetical protein [Pseudonocardia sp.]
MVASFIPKLLLFLVIMLIGWLIAKALRKLITMVLHKVGLERAVEKGGLSTVLAGSKYDASGLIAAIVYYAILLITLQIAFGAFGANPVSDLLAGIVAFLPRIIVALIIVVVAAAIAAAVKDLVGGMLGRQSYGRIVATIAQVFIIGLGVIAALSQIGVAVAVTLPVLITVLATVGGILIVGVGGGLIAPMRSRWEKVLDRAEQETGTQSGQHAQGNDPTGPIPATDAGNGQSRYASSEPTP